MVVDLCALTSQTLACLSADIFVQAIPHVRCGLQPWVRRAGGFEKRCRGSMREPVAWSGQARCCIIQGILRRLRLIAEVW